MKQGQLTLSREDYEVRGGQPPRQSLPKEGDEVLAPEAEGKDILDTSM